MKNQIASSIVCCVICLGVASFGIAQDNRRNALQEFSNALPQNGPVVGTAEERIIRETYEKLTNLTRAAAMEANGTSVAPNDNQCLRFELSNFHVGDIGEIRKSTKSDLITGPTGEIITLTNIVSKHNDQEEHVAYKALWTNSQYTSISDRHWSVGDLLDLAPKLYYDVGEYALYDVTVSYQGKSRSYRALAIFHSLYGSSESPKPFFWDNVVGIGGTLNDVWNEKRPLVGQKAEVKQSSSLRPYGISQLNNHRLRILPANWTLSRDVV